MLLLNLHQIHWSDCLLQNAHFIYASIETATCLTEQNPPTQNGKMYIPISKHKTESSNNQNSALNMNSAI